MRFENENETMYLRFSIDKYTIPSKLLQNIALQQFSRPEEQEKLSNKICVSTNLFYLKII